MATTATRVRPAPGARFPLVPGGLGVRCGVLGARAQRVVQRVGEGVRGGMVEGVAIAMSLADGRREPAAQLYGEDGVEAEFGEGAVAVRGLCAGPGGRRSRRRSPRRRGGPAAAVSRARARPAEEPRPAGARGRCGGGRRVGQRGGQILVDAGEGGRPVDLHAVGVRLRRRGQEAPQPALAARSSVGRTACSRARRVEGLPDGGREDGVRAHPRRRRPPGRRRRSAPSARTGPGCGSSRTSSPRSVRGCRRRCR